MVTKKVKNYNIYLPNIHKNKLTTNINNQYKTLTQHYSTICMLLHLVALDQYATKH